MRKLIDLPDERRAAKSWLPASDKDVTEGRVIWRDFPAGRYPACVEHGALLRVSPPPHRIYRCMAPIGEFRTCGVGAQVIEE